MARYTIRGARPATRAALDLDRELNAEQREVVLHPGGALLVLAGAGTGKTRTLTFRAARLIETGVDPDRILLCTFTNRAAREMVERMEGILGAELRPRWAGTFHRIGNLALRRHGEAVGVAPDYAILDREDARDLLGASLAEVLGKRLRQRRYPTPHLLLHLASLAASCELTLEQVLARHAPRHLDLAGELTRVVAHFRERKRRLGLLDYDDLLEGLRALLEDGSESAGALPERFEHVLVDEYQDTNRIQGRIVDLCARRHGNITVVGDDAQSIYSFRGAHFENIMAFPQRYPGARVFKLELSYRCTPEVLALANASIARNARQHPKRLRSARGPGMRPALIPVSDVYVQAAFVAQRLLELAQEEGIPLSQMAVLYRAHAHGLELQMELSRRRVPFAVRSGLRFFEQAHIKDVLAYLRLVHNAGDPLAWRRVLGLWPGVGKRSVERLLAAMESAEGLPAGAAARLRAEPVVAAAPGSAREALGRLAGLLADLEATPDPPAVIRGTVAAHYKEHAESTFRNAATRLEDLEQLADYARRYDGIEPFLSDLALVAGIGAEVVADAEAPEEQLTLSTIHQAKGLEWRVVFVLSLSEGRFPQPMAVRREEDVEEERRLFYVAVTRAREQLYLLQPRFHEDSRGGARILRRSRFLRELAEAGAPPYERWEIEET